MVNIELMLSEENKIKLEKINNWLIPLLYFLMVLILFSFEFDISNQKNIPQFLENLDAKLEGLEILIFIILFLPYSVLYLVDRRLKPSRIEFLKAIGKNELIAENVENLFDGYLYSLSKKLEFGKYADNNERVTIYIHDKKNHFVPFGRYSANPEFSKINRVKYPDKEGCIAKGWQNDWYFDNNFPEDENDYSKYVKETYGISDEIIKNINMKSRVYAVKRIDMNSDQLAVIVVESMRSNRFASRTIRAMLDQEEEFVGQMIIQLNEHIPSPDNLEGKERLK